MRSKQKKSMLDDIKTYEKYDRTDVNFQIERLPEQLLRAWEETRSMNISVRYKNIDKVVFVGMGGSGLAAHLFETTFASELKIPVQVVHAYTLPAFVSSKTLVVFLSFSGDTEEVLLAYDDAKKKNAKRIVISSGGKLTKKAKRDSIPLYAFSPKDLARSASLGLGFLFGGLVGILEKVGVVKITDARIRRVVKAMTDVVDSCSLDVNGAENPAKVVAKEFIHKSILFVASEHLTGSVHVINHLTNELSKQYSRFLTIPELNHHFLESLARPEGVFSKIGTLMIHSDHYHKRNKIRFHLTAQTFEKMHGCVIDYEARGKDRFEESVEMLQFGSFFAYYLGILNKVEVGTLPFTDFFKKKMAKEK